MQGCAKKINQKNKKKMTPIETILRLKVQVEGSYRKSGEEYQDNIPKDDSPWDKGISNIIS